VPHIPKNDVSSQNCAKLDIIGQIWLTWVMLGFNWTYGILIGTLRLNSYIVGTDALNAHTSLTLLSLSELSKP